MRNSYHRCGRLAGSIALVLALLGCREAATAQGLPSPGGGADPIRESISREVSVFNFGAPTAPNEAVSREFSVYNGLSLPVSEILQIVSRESSVFNFGAPSSTSEIISRESSVYNFGSPPARIEALTREASVYNGLSIPATDYLQVVSREVSVYNLGAPTAAFEALSREVSIYNFLTPPARLPTDFATGQLQFEAIADTRPGNPNRATVPGVTPLPSAGLVSIPNGLATHTGPAFRSGTGFPMVQLDTARDLTLLHPAREALGAAIGVPIPEAAEYLVTGSFARESTLRGTGNGVSVALMRNLDTTNLLFTARIASDHAVDADQPFAGTGVVRFTVLAELQAGDVLRFAVFNGAQGQDNEEDLVTLQALVVAAPLANGSLASSRPLIAEQPASASVRLGQSVQFQVRAFGEEPLRYQWRRDGYELLGQTGPTLVIPSAAGTDSGEYTVEVGNPFGRVRSEPARLEVLEPPSILQAPAEQSLVLGSGQPIQLQVLATGSAPLHFDWFKDGIRLNGMTNASFEKRLPVLADTGAYSVRVTNVVGAITSAPVVVRVVEPVRLGPAPSPQSAVLGQRVVLTASAFGSEPLSYQWKKNGQNIPDATQSSYVIESVSLADAGLYSVAVANDAGAVLSDPTELVVRLPSAPPGDTFAQPVSLGGQLNGSITTTNTAATRQSSEPFHAGKPGNHSVWFAWTAPASGQAAFDTIGSAFDTLLAVYSGTELATLREVASDDDHGGFFTSRLQFNALNGTTYLIAVDGLGNDAGRLVLSWNLAVAPPLPVITQQPASITVAQGGNVALQVRANNAQSFQWRFNGNPIPGATAADLLLANLRPAQVGAYEVVVGGGGAFLLSQEAVVEIGDDSAVRSYDKLEDTLGPSLNGPAPQSRVARSNPLRSTALTAPPALVVSAGLPRTQILDNSTATTQQREQTQCGVIGYHSRWLAIKPESNGTLVIDTPGATFPVVLALYTSGRLTDTAVVCTTGEPLRYSQATSGRTYYLAVDGLDGAAGTIAVECRLGQAPVPQTTRPSPQRFHPDDRFTLRATTLPVTGPASTYLWLRNGVPVVGISGNEWELVVRDPSDAGTYRVVIDNGIGRVTNEVARIVVDVPLRMAGPGSRPDPRFEAGEFVFALRGNAGQEVIVQRSANLAAWNTDAALWLSAEGLGEYRDGRGPAGAQFYRVSELPLQLLSAGQIFSNGGVLDAFQVTGGVLGQRYAIEQSLDAGKTWSAIHTNTIQEGTYQFEAPTGLGLLRRVRLLEE